MLSAKVAEEPDHSPASSGERAILRVACHLAARLPGQPSERWSLQSMLSGLDTTNSLLARRAVAMAALGPDAVGPL